MLLTGSMIFDVRKRWVRALADKDVVATTQQPGRAARMFHSSLSVIERERGMVNQDAIFTLEYVE
jgi:hypothetical protein